ncbi:hypothetical protein ACFV1L_10145 [Kitasatospora sp. NPDC059646]|uniref:hypothetical protein n=1 Tax=Kitasatospora sp. NPDC059646 TaxID=3346893 RepID=UPI0036915F6F
MITVRRERTASLEPLSGDVRALDSAAARPGGRMLLTSTGPVVELPSGVPSFRTPGPGGSTAPAFTADDAVPAAADASGRVVLWDGALTRRLGTLLPRPARTR